MGSITVSTFAIALLCGRIYHEMQNLQAVSPPVAIMATPINDGHTLNIKPKRLYLRTIDSTNVVTELSALVVGKKSMCGASPFYCGGANEK
jgi:hypothetical protein